jgi:ATP synthase protein I
MSDNKYYDILSAASFGIMLLLSVVVGLLIGLFLDNLLHSSPWFVLIFTFIGMISGIYSVFREIRRFQKEKH